jgi:hypothetical protein
MIKKYNNYNINIHFIKMMIIKNYKLKNINKVLQHYVFIKILLKLSNNHKQPVNIVIINLLHQLIIN